jgi:type II secretory pathway pseudopilin PulG
MPCPVFGSRRPGRGVVEVIVVTAILGFVAILVMMALPRGRETARMASCQKNLMHIGTGLQMYHAATRHYPTVSPLGSSGDGPIKAMLDALVIPDLLDLNDPSKPPKSTQSPPRGTRVPRLACPSDPNAMASSTSPIISYRADTGDDPGGLGGPFQPGRAMISAQVEAADGLAFTAAFSERLTGDRQDRQPAPWNYATSPAELTRGVCPDLQPDRWRGDAGSDWSEASWRSTLYNHARTPNAAPSCIAEDGRSALMGASSGHVNRINVLMMDGSLRVITPAIDPRIWAAMATVGPSDSKPGP